MKEQTKEVVICMDECFNGNIGNLLRKELQDGATIEITLKTKSKNPILCPNYANVKIKRVIQDSVKSEILAVDVRAGEAFIFNSDGSGINIRSENGQGVFQYMSKEELFKRIVSKGFIVVGYPAEPFIKNE